MKLKRVNITIPQDLYVMARKHRINISGLTARAIAEALTAPCGFLCGDEAWKLLRDSYENGKQNAARYLK